MIRRVLADTGPLVEFVVQGATRQREVVACLETVRPPLLTCWPVLTEAAYLLRRQPGSFERLLDAVDSGELQIEPLTATDLTAIRALMAKYRDLRLQLADACLIHLADRCGSGHVLTFGARDFGAARTLSGRALTVLPAAGSGGER